jgi:hypothetical protein
MGQINVPRRVGRGWQLRDGSVSQTAKRRATAFEPQALAFSGRARGGGQMTAFDMCRIRARSSGRDENILLPALGGGRAGKGGHARGWGGPKRSGEQVGRYPLRRGPAQAQYQRDPWPEGRYPGRRLGWERGSRSSPVRSGTELERDRRKACASKAFPVTFFLFAKSEPSRWESKDAP